MQRFKWRAEDLIDLFSVFPPSLTEDKLNIDENGFDNDNFISYEEEAEDGIKEEEGELQAAKPVLIKFQSVVKASESKNLKTNTPKMKCLKCGKKYRFMHKHSQESCDKENERKEKKEKYKVPCEQCGKLVAGIKGMKIHMERHTPKQERTYYNCDKCAYRTLSKMYLRRHLENHAGVVLETCHLCGGKYKRLEKHIKRNHNSNLKYFENILIKCEICGKEIKKARLSNHMKQVHTERKHACHLCSYKAQTNYNLKLHISKSHLGVKELEKEQCPHCDVITSNLPYHLNTYHP